MIADNGYEYVIECIPRQFRHLYVPMRGELWYVNFKIIFWFLAFAATRKRDKYALRGCYIASVCKAIGARLIVTMIDNNNWDTGLAEHAGIRVVCIGNGFRRPEQIYDKAFDCYFALNNLPNERSLPFRITSREYYSVGHIKMGIFQKLKERNQVRSPFTQHVQPYAVWISQYRSYMHDIANVRLKWNIWGARTCPNMRMKMVLLPVSRMPRN